MAVPDLNGNIPGPGSGPVVLCSASAEWFKTLACERERLVGALGETLIRLAHIGSTAIPGIRAKPIVDLLPIVADLPSLDRARGRLEAVGYHWWGEYGIDGRRYCTLQHPRTGKRVVNAHFFAAGDAHIERHLAFRDYLCAHPEVAAEYEAVKVRAAERHPDDVNDYNGAKSAWIRSIEPPAIIWYRLRD